jgi:hypothetical protein
MKKFLKWFFSIFIGGFIGIFIIAVIADEPKKDGIQQKEVETKTVKKEDVKLEAITICKMLIEKKLSIYKEINFHSMDRKVFEKEDQRYIVKYPLSFTDENNINKSMQSHCDIKFNGGDKMDMNNWSLLELEIL